QHDIEQVTVDDEAFARAQRACTEPAGQDRCQWMLRLFAAATDDAYALVAVQQLGLALDEVDRALDALGLLEEPVAGLVLLQCGLARERFQVLALEAIERGKLLEQTEWDFLAAHARLSESACCRDHR